MDIKKGNDEIIALIHEKLQNYNKEYITESDELSFLIENRKGICVAGIVASKDLDCITIDYLFVDEKYRNLGYAKKLMLHMEERAKELGASRIILNTFEFQAPKLYEKLGYEIFGKIEPCIGNYGQYFYKKEL